MQWRVKKEEEKQEMGNGMDAERALSIKQLKVEEKDQTKLIRVGTSSKVKVVRCNRCDATKREKVKDRTGKEDEEHMHGWMDARETERERETKLMRGI
jgi:hypothetical protein